MNVLSRRLGLLVAATGAVLSLITVPAPPAFADPPAGPAPAAPMAAAPTATVTPGAVVAPGATVTPGTVAVPGVTVAPGATVVPVTSPAVPPATPVTSSPAPSGQWACRPAHMGRYWRWDEVRRWSHWDHLEWNPRTRHPEWRHYWRDNRYCVWVRVDGPPPGSNRPVGTVPPPSPARQAPPPRF